MINFPRLSILLNIACLTLLWLKIVWPNFYFGLSSDEHTIYYIVVSTMILLQLVIGYYWSNKTNTNLFGAVYPVLIPIVFTILLELANML